MVIEHGGAGDSGNWKANITWSALQEGLRGHFPVGIGIVKLMTGARQTINATKK